MMNLKLILNLVLIRTTVFCFNIEDRDVIVKKAPDDQTYSYFGFSVSLHKTTANSQSLSDNWILVGAPLGQNLQPNTNRSGALFKCPFSALDNDCVQVPTDGHRLEEFDYDDGVEDNSLKPPGADEIKSGQWLGVTVTSQKPGGLVLVCAHRYIQSPDLTRFHFGQGLCYILDNYLKTQESLQYCKGRPTEKLHQQFGFCQIGTSTSFVGDDFALVGSPGPYTWRGTVFGQVVVGDFLTRDKTVYRGPLNDNPTPIDKYSYLGMSVAGGHFFNKKKYTYASGAPRSLMKGQVFFLEKNYNQPTTEELNITLNITGEQFGSGFGYQILSGDFNSDGFDDILVAAPFYYADTKGGAVYVYLNLKKCTSDEDCKPNQVLYGKLHSRFGFAMTSIGDINKDGYNDVAIGAPYDQENGAVYIFLGSKNGLIEKPSQVIRIKQLRTFGYSLSGGLDMDGNGYPDLLVGAYESDRAILFQTRPIIDIKIDIKGDELRSINTSKLGCAADPYNNNNTCFSFKSCFTIVGEVKQFSSFSVNYHVEEIKARGSRIWFRDTRHVNKKSSELRRSIEVNSISEPYCQSETVYINEGVRDILTPLTFRVKYSMENNEPHSPILNRTSLKEFQATFQKDCGDDDICKSNLVLKAGTNLEKNADGQYAINMVNKAFVVEANVKNLGESAYEAKLFVTHPDALSYVTLDTDKDKPSHVICGPVNKTQVVMCDLGNPLRRDNSVKLRLKFETRENAKDQKLNIHLFVNSTSLELSNRTSQNVVVILQKIAKFLLAGRASTNLRYGGKVKGESDMKYLEDIGSRVVHKYEIYNTGEWNLQDVKVNIRWPYQVWPGQDDREGKWLLYLESLPTVTGAGVMGVCNIEDKSVINPLNLNYSSIVIDEPENLLLPEEYLFSNGNKTAQTSRRRRDAEYVVPIKIIERGGQQRKVVYLDCKSGTAKCVNIECHIKKLAKKNQAVIGVKSLLWNSTLVEDYSEVDWVEIHSTAQVTITDATFEISEDSVMYFSAETIAYPEISLVSGLNWWIIGGAVLAGLLLLIVLVIILYKCGFFKRKRVSKDPTLSGSLLQKDEADNLLKEK